MYGIKSFLFGLMVMSMVVFSGCQAPDDVCADMQKIKDAFKRSNCKLTQEIIQITNASCTTVKNLLHCVAESIYGYGEREHREPCVLHMRTAIQDTDSMFPAFHFTWRSCSTLWCKLGVEYTDAQFKCIFWCIGGPAAIGIGGVLALISLVTIGLPALGFGAAGIVANNIAATIMAWWAGAVPAGGIIAIGIGYKAILGTFLSAAAISRAAMDCNCCEK
ncbi:hypothetical protein MAR_004275 [Mya arenaria]|uniref:Uncharacterized protein n=1 Tax=Mya arenaria TaxID=6604 RepID=A0ABY7EXV1_MYAAR|nr:uncharacterized protein LOC128203497 [Mya arenaria]WAR14170.1 hypothetical protein MAR_004275 [Mya arenaria]